VVNLGLFQETLLLLKEVYNWISDEETNLIDLRGPELRAYLEVMDYCEAISNAATYEEEREI
jgi:hypothetical protein